MYLVNSPFWLQWLYPSLTWHKSRKEKRIYLTFDDGPIPVVTPFVLNTLKKYDAKATFFCIGDNVAKHPDVFQQILADGHSIGNHTYNHLNGWKTSDRFYIDNIQKCYELLKCNLFRPPYGKIKRSQISYIKSQQPNLNIIMWDVLSGDFDPDITAEKCLNNVIKHAQNGSVIVFHDSVKAYPRLEFILPNILELLTNKGYSFCCL